MNGGSIVGLRAADGADDEHVRLLSHLDLSDAMLTLPDHAPDDPPAVPRELLMPALATLLAVAWIGGALWLARGELSAMGAVAAIEFVAALAVVPVLLGIGWLLLQRNSRAEARRFGVTAAAMRGEAASLERTVARLTASVVANRATLADEVAALARIGDSSAERLGGIGHALADETALARRNADGVAQSADAARASLAALVAGMPHAREEVAAAADLLDRTALSAAGHGSALDAQLVALADRGREAEVVTGGAAQKLAAHIARMEATSETAGARLEAVTATMAEAVDAVLDRTAQAVDESRKGIAAQGDAMLAMVGASQATLDVAARESAESLAERIAIIEQVIERIALRLDAQRRAGDALVDGLTDGIDDVDARLGRLHTQGIERSQLLAGSISALGGSADAMTEALKAGDAMATRAIGTAETLLIALDSAAREIDETLPDAFDRLDGRVVASQQVVSAAKPELLALVTAAESTHDAIEAIAQVIAQQRTTVEQLSGTLLDTLATGRTRADALGQLVDDAIGRSHRFAEDAAPRLLDALLRVRDTATAAADRARDTLASVIPEAAEALGEASSEAMRRATADTVERHVAAVSQVADAAVTAAARASDRLDRQVKAIADATALVEARLEESRAQREEADRDGFAARVSLLIESLNSASIDITRIVSPDVSDSAWAAYLKGDRGVFTRRAVRLLDAGQAREIMRLYDGDDAFRDHVNRYIHDFEAMLRTILAQRDGSHLGVTLLSSDMGKLYVALAQAIERLR